MIDSEVKKYIDRSVLCWLATVDKDNAPNVSPKEMFVGVDEKTLWIAHIASPNSLKNIQHNPNVCVSFVDVFIQKGYKLKGRARIIGKADPSFSDKAQFLTDFYSDKFPIRAVIEVTVNKVEPILAPSYYLFPEIAEKDQIESALKTYQVRQI